MDLDLRGAIGERTRAVVPVHLYGHAVDTDAAPRGHARARHRDRGGLRGRSAPSSEVAAPGRSGTPGCFSFYPTKNLPRPVTEEWW